MIIHAYDLLGLPVRTSSDSHDTSNSGPTLSFIACDARDRIEDVVHPLSVVSEWKRNLYKDQDGSIVPKSSKNRSARRPKMSARFSRLDINRRLTGGAIQSISVYWRTCTYADVGLERESCVSDMITGELMKLILIDE